jgi:glycosyltransferase involved in cell wall biosynthesis
MGFYQHPIADAVELYLRCESGIGYRGSSAKNFRAFESLALQHFTYGSEHPGECINGNYYDRVIPNYFDPEDFEFSDEKEDYFLYIGRMILRKGILTAIKTCDFLGKKLIIVGQGGWVENGWLVTPEFKAERGMWDYQGFADIPRRKELMSRALGVFVPTEYIEPFGGAFAESMISGSPPITTNFGVFPGTIPDCINGKLGFRCNVLQDFVEAASVCAQKNLDYAAIREYGHQFLMDEVKWEFQRWFEDLHNLWESTVDKDVKGWHRVSPERMPYFQRTGREG